MSALLFLLGGCASKNYDYILKDNTILSYKKIDSYIYPQDKFYCGPSSLATVLKKEGIWFDYSKLVSTTFTPALKGTLQPQMKASLRSYGLIPYETCKDLSCLLKEISINNSQIIVLLNLGLKLHPVWHYSVLLGYDKKEKKVFLSAPDGSETWMSFEEFERFYNAGGSWSVVALKKDKIPVSSGENEILMAILDMYEIGQKEIARGAAVTYISKYPSSYKAMVLLSNIYLDMQEYKSAIFVYKEILKIKPDEASILNNLAIALSGDGKHEEAKKYALKAISLGGKFANRYKSTLDKIESAIKEDR